MSQVMTVRRFNVFIWTLIILFNVAIWVIFPFFTGNKWVATIDNVEHHEKERTEVQTMDAKFEFRHLGICWKSRDAKIVRNGGLWYERVDTGLVELAANQTLALIDAWEEKYSEGAKRSKELKEDTLAAITEEPEKETASD